MADYRTRVFCAALRLRAEILDRVGYFITCVRLRILDGLAGPTLDVEPVRINPQAIRPVQWAASGGEFGASAPANAEPPSRLTALDTEYPRGYQS